MKQKLIQVGEAVMEQAILLCQREQEQCTQKNCTSLPQLILRHM